MADCGTYLAIAGKQVDRQFAINKTNPLPEACERGLIHVARTRCPLFRLEVSVVFHSRSINGSEPVIASQSWRSTLDSRGHSDRFLPKVARLRRCGRTLHRDTPA